MHKMAQHYVLQTGPGEDNSCVIARRAWFTSMPQVGHGSLKLQQACGSGGMQALNGCSGPLSCVMYRGVRGAVASHQLAGPI
jgi:hypothetical protein